MIKYLLPILFCILQISAIHATPNDYSAKANSDLREKLRHVYYAGVEDDRYVDSLKNIIVNNFGEDYSDDNSLIIAYRGGVLALQSKHAFWPFNKMSYLNDSMDFFAKAVKADPDNLEIRFMRFSILYYVPGILGYDEEEEDDLKIVYSLLLEKNYSMVEQEIQKGMIEFVLDTELLNKEEEQKLNNIIVFADSHE